jgi:uncharacterized protein (TIGR03435 family)
MAVAFPSRRRVATIIVLTSAVGRLIAQSPSSPSANGLDYEASIRRNMVPDARPIGGQGRRPDGFVATATTPRTLVTMAYERFPFGRIVGLPDWTNDERYDVSVKVPGELKDFRELLQALLRDRFNLRSHSEVRPVPAYLLVMARSDGRLGPRLTPESVNCDDPEAVRKARENKAPGEPLCNGVAGRNRIWMRGMRIGSLANSIASLLDRPVIDRTGLTGRYDFDLEYLAVSGVPDPSDTSGRVSIFTAVQEQLGLRLQSEDVPLEILVIDRIDRPTQN